MNDNMADQFNLFGDDGPDLGSANPVPNPFEGPDNETAAPADTQTPTVALSGEDVKATLEKLKVLGLDPTTLLAIAQAPNAPPPKQVEPAPAEAVPQQTSEAAPGKTEAIPPPAQVEQLEKIPEQKPSKVIEFTPKATEPGKNPVSKAPVTETAELANPLQQQVDEINNKGKSQSVFERLPIFKYGSSEDEITDPNITFEQLRLDKMDDFDELKKGKEVKWSVVYGGCTQEIANPQESRISDIKNKIENSPKFLEALKKMRPKDADKLRCQVKPSIKMQTKGQRCGYRGYFDTVEEAMASSKTLCLVPTKSGHLFQIRKERSGVYMAPVQNDTRYDILIPGFRSAFPPIPYGLFQQIVSFFRSYMQKDCELETLVNIYWDTSEETYVAAVPAQVVSKASIRTFPMPEDALDEERYVHFADIHSHNSMKAQFSEKDDQDERATRVYIVVGRLDEPVPSVLARVSVNGYHVPIPLSRVLEAMPAAEYPPEWRDKVQEAAA